MLGDAASLRVAAARELRLAPRDQAVRHDAAGHVDAARSAAADLADAVRDGAVRDNAARHVDAAAVVAGDLRAVEDADAPDADAGVGNGEGPSAGVGAVDQGGVGTAPMMEMSLFIVIRPFIT